MGNLIVFYGCFYYGFCSVLGMRDWGFYVIVFFGSDMCFYFCGLLIWVFVIIIIVELVDFDCF